MWLNPKIFTKTYHRIGATYINSYFGHTYKVLGHGALNGYVCVQDVATGMITEHCSQLSYKDKRTDSVETNSMVLEALKNSRW